MNDAPIIELRLTPDQAEQLAPLVRTAASRRENVLFFSTAAPYIDDGQARWRLQAASVSFRTGQKILKLIALDTEPPSASPQNG
jgi:hypothetical protein